MILLLLLFVIGTLSPALAQDMPAESPKATVTQRIGWTDVSITYSRPRTRGRTIWGELVAWGEVWRTGANYPTFLETSDQLDVEGQPLPPGRYALYTIPGPEHWTIIFSRNTELWGAFEYSADHDQLRVQVTPREGPRTESFTIEFSNVQRGAATLLLRWARLVVPISLTVDISARIHAAVEANEEGDWATSWRGAAYLVETGGDLSVAKRWIERSVAVERNWMNVWTLAEVLAAIGGPESALAAGREALQLCREQQPYCRYSLVYASRIEQWKP